MSAKCLRLAEWAPSGGQNAHAGGKGLIDNDDQQARAITDELTAYKLEILDWEESI